MERLFPQYNRKMLTMKELHTALFVAPTGVGETHLALDLLQQEYLNHFDFNVTICTTLRYNAMYNRWKWFWTDPHIIQIEPCNHLYDLIEKLGNILARLSLPVDFFVTDFCFPNSIFSVNIQQFNDYLKV